MSTKPERSIPPAPLNYKEAGVDIDKGNELVRRIKPIAQKTHRSGLLSGIGGFSALFELPVDRYQQPILVSSTDGVGTKLRLALDLQKHTGIGIDLVAMCVNDLVVCGAEPLFFLDYYATGKLDVDIAEEVISSIARGCEMAGASLVGGETAEMPGHYHGNDYDLAGFSVGVVEKSKIIDGSRVKPNDVLIALASSGAHSNGYSLIRKILEIKKADLTQSLTQSFGNQSLGDVLLTPTKIYVKTLLRLFNDPENPIHACAHITGGGLTENIPRVLPKHTEAVIDLSSWTLPALFQWIREAGQLEASEMLRTFNCGVGMVLCVSESRVQKTLLLLEELGEKAWAMGHIQSSVEASPCVVFKGRL